MSLRAFFLSSVLVSSSTQVPRIVGPADRPPGRADAAGAGDVRFVRTDTSLTIATWNIRAGKDASLDDLAARLARLDADVIALQEVEVGTRGAGGLDQSWELAQRLGMRRAFAPTLPRDGGLYGIALLTRLPIDHVDRIELSGAMGLEPRVVLDAALDDDGEPLHVLVTHADVLPWAGQQHAAELAQKLRARMGQRVVLLGDFNATPDTAGVKGLVGTGLVDTVAAYDARPTGPPSPWRSRIDYVFMDAPLASLVDGAAVVDTDGSDHLPVVVKLRARDALDNTLRLATGPRR